MMKALKFTLAFVLTLFLSSCLDTEEKIVINADKSGMYSMTMDLGKMLEMAASMGAKPDSDKPKEKKDTVIYLKDFLTTENGFTSEEASLYGGALLDIKMDEEKNQMKIVVSCPFKNAAGLTAVKQHLFSIIKKAKAFENATGEKSGEGDKDDTEMAEKSTNPVGDQFTFLATPGMISNTIRSMDEFKNKIESDSSLIMMKQMSGMMGDFKYRTILVLPKAVKKFEGPGSVVSADKKTITFETTLTEMMENPEKVSYKVSY
ncbi:hypothetical protein BH11BAC3_BH11BAC3_34940 [soil metagenome]